VLRLAQAVAQHVTGKEIRKSLIASADAHAVGPRGAPAERTLRPLLSCALS
jgi:hypothetical protein